MYPSFNVAKTESAIMGYGVLFEHRGVVGVVWWEGDTYFYRGLLW